MPKQIKLNTESFELYGSGLKDVKGLQLTPQPEGEPLGRVDVSSGDFAFMPDAPDSETGLIQIKKAVYPSDTGLYFLEVADAKGNVDGLIVEFVGP